MKQPTTTRATHRGVEIAVLSDRIGHQTMFSCTNGWQSGQCWGVRYVTAGVVAFLAIVLPQSQVAKLFDEVFAFPGYSLTVDLPRQVVVKPDGVELPFDVQPFRKYCLVNGFDDIGLTLRHADKIRAFEAERLARMPWLAQTRLG